MEVNKERARIWSFFFVLFLSFFLIKTRTGLEFGSVNG